MRYTIKLFTLFFAAIIFIGAATIDTSAQRRYGRVIYRRPIVVSPYYYYNSFGYWNGFGNSYFGDPFFYDPYLRERQQKSYLRGELRGNQKELRKHLEKYNADGVITAKERRELEDDYRDVARAKRDLADFEDAE